MCGRGRLGRGGPSRRGQNSGWNCRGRFERRELWRCGSRRSEEMRRCWCVHRCSGVCRRMLMRSRAYLCWRRRVCGHCEDLSGSLGRRNWMQRCDGRLGKGGEHGRTGARRCWSGFMFRSRHCGFCRSVADRCGAWRCWGVPGSGGGIGCHWLCGTPQLWPEACAAACACFNSFGSCLLILRNSLATPASRWPY